MGEKCLNEKEVQVSSLMRLPRACPHAQTNMRACGGKVGCVICDSEQEGVVHIATHMKGEKS